MQIQDLGHAKLARYKFFIYLNGLPLPEEYERMFAALEAQGKTVIRLDAKNPPASAALRKTFQQHGVHVYLEADDVFACSQTCLMIHAAAGGVKQVVLPTPMDIFNIVDGKTVGVRLERFSIEMKFGETALFAMTKS